SVATAKEELEWLSDRISTQVRWVAAGTLAVAWGLLLTPPTTLAVSQKGILAVILTSLTALVIDLLHYISGYFHVFQHLGEEGVNQRAIDREFLSRLRAMLFWLKLVVAIAGFGVLAVALGKQFT